MIVTNMFTKRFGAQLLLFNVQLTFCCAVAETNELDNEGGEVSFLQLTAKIAHNAADEAGTRVQLGATAGFEYTEGFAGSSAGGIFCYAIECPTDVTGKQIRQQMQGCDGYAVFSYYSNPEEHTVELYSEAEITRGKTTRGWTDNARLMPPVFSYIINSDLPERFTWFVKVDPDSFFRPRFLYPILAKFDAESPIVVGTCPHDKTPRVRGAMETFSHKVFRQKSTSLLLDMNVTGGEDDELAKQIDKAGFQMTCVDQSEDCNTMFFDYDNVGYDEKFNASVIPSVLREFFANPNITCKELPSVYGQYPNRIGRNVVLAHPIKDIKTYEELQALDNASRMD